MSSATPAAAVAAAPPVHHHHAVAASPPPPTHPRPAANANSLRIDNRQHLYSVPLHKLDGRGRRDHHVHLTAHCADRKRCVASLWTGTSRIFILASFMRKLAGQSAWSSRPFREAVFALLGNGRVKLCVRARGDFSRARTGARASTLGSVATMCDRWSSRARSCIDVCVEDRIQDKGSGREHERVAIRRRPCGGFVTQVAAGAHTRIDHHLLAQSRRHDLAASHRPTKSVPPR